MNNVSVFGNANLPAVNSISNALRNIQTDTSSAGGVTILKMDRTGHWVYGASETEVDNDSVWAVNPFSFTHGFIAWGEGEVLGEKMVSVTEPVPQVEPAPAAAKRGWETQVGFSLKCIDGEDKGEEVRYAVTSVGGKRAVQTLAVNIANQVETDQTKPVAVVSLGKEHYQHKAYGRIYTPMFDIVEWISLDGEPATEDTPQEVIEDDAPATRRRRA
jgi:hypothetical protein